jgi:hypothetical protein
LGFISPLARPDSYRDLPRADYSIGVTPDYEVQKLKLWLEGNYMCDKNAPQVRRLVGNEGNWVLITIFYIL